MKKVHEENAPVECTKLVATPTYAKTHETVTAVKGGNIKYQCVGVEYLCSGIFQFLPFFKRFADKLF